MMGGIFNMFSSGLKGMGGTDPQKPRNMGVMGGGTSPAAQASSVALGDGGGMDVKGTQEMWNNQMKDRLRNPGVAGVNPHDYGRSGF